MKVVETSDVDVADVDDALLDGGIAERGDDLLEGDLEDVPVVGELEALLLAEVAPEIAAKLISDSDFDHGGLELRDELGGETE